MKLAVEYSAAERFVIDLLKISTAGLSPKPGVGQSLPTGWKVGSLPFLRVALDGSVLLQPIAEVSTVRVTAWIAPATSSVVASPTAAERLAQRARGLLLAEGPVTPGAGLLPAQDPTTKAELVSFTVEVRLRSTLIAGS